MGIEFQCRSCGGRDGALVLDLGLQPLANNYLRPEDVAKPEPKFPLRLAVCRGCWLLQIVDLVPPTRLFSEYLYFSSFSDAWLRHSQQAVERYIAEFSLDRESFVMEIASNDGYLLKNFVAAGVPCLGIEPAANIAKVARENGIETVVEFFGPETARRLEGQRGQADLLLGNNVFAHAPDTNDFVAGLRAALKPRGRIVLEFPYGADFIEKSEFDTIYHEHVFYFTLTPLLPLFRRHGLEIFHVEKTLMHGGSLRLFGGHTGKNPVRPSVEKFRSEEERNGVSGLSYYESFSNQAANVKVALRALLTKLKADGKSIGAYGAAAKGSTLLNYCGIGCETIDFVVDRSPHKIGRLMPGVHVTILPAAELALRRPDYALLLAWNFADEILEQQRAYREAGGRFIIPVPEVRIV